MAYKMVNNLVPDYLVSLLPQSRERANTHNLQNNQNLTTAKTRLESFRKSHIPSMIQLWNSLSVEAKMLPSLYSFKHVKPIISKQIHIPWDME
jgi:hypothetical protein